MKREFTFAWICWAAILVFGEFLAIPELRSTINTVALIVFAVVEGVGVGRPKPGDTLSEHVWAFYGARKARIPLIVGVALFFGVRLYEIGYPELVIGTVSIARAALALGLVGWLIPHFVLRGRAG